LKLAIVTGVWKRPEVFKLFAKGMHDLRASSSLDITVIVAGSEGIKSRSMVEQYPFYYIEAKNDPLAAKMNVCGTPEGLLLPILNSACSVPSDFTAL
jgi:hypothetical protein